MKRIYYLFPNLWSIPPMVLVGCGLILIFLFLLVWRLLLRQATDARRAEKLAEINEYQNLFFTKLTHELRTPLEIISSLAGEAARDPDAWMDKGMVMIRRNCHQLLYLVDQIQELTRLESGLPMSVNLIQGDIVHYISYLTGSFQGYAEIKGLHLELELETTSFYMDFDPEKISSCFFNLVSNAVKYTPTGGKVKIVVSGSAPHLDGSPAELENYQFVTSGPGQWRGGALIIRIQDTGCGIPEEILPRIFDRLANWNKNETRSKQGTASYNNPPPGLGIGLALTRELVKKQNGKIAVRSQLGKGTEFAICLPVTREAPQSSLILNRNQMQRRHFQSHYDLFKEDHSQLTDSSQDEFLIKVKKIIEEHCSDRDFCITQLCEELYISRPQLHRKLKALTNKSTSQVIRSVRMQKAKELLQLSKMNVSEVGYAVGYNNPSYFTQEFSKEFGEAPSHFRNGG